MISCLCITRKGRLAMLARAIGDFVRQTLCERELVIVHDGDAGAHDRILRLAARHAGQVIRVVRTVPGQTLGALRNQAVAQAGGDWLCQWDDDDRYHPQRLALQWQTAQRDGAVANFLADQLHWFQADGVLTWDDWDSEPYPLNLIQGSLLARRDIMPSYPDLARGEDTQLTHQLLRDAAASGLAISRLRDAGWCYVYVYHGANVWDADHHRAISAAKHLPAHLLLPRLNLLHARLAEYHPALPTLRVPMGGGRQSVLIQS